MAIIAMMLCSCTDSCNRYKLVSSNEGRVGGIFYNTAALTSYEGVIDSLNKHFSGCNIYFIDFISTNSDYDLLKIKFPYLPGNTYEEYLESILPSIVVNNLKATNPGFVSNFSAKELKEIKTAIREKAQDETSPQLIGRLIIIPRELTEENCINSETWVQDHMLIMQAQVSGITYIKILYNKSETMEDLIMYLDTVSDENRCWPEYMVIETQQAPYNCLQGGNILASGDFVLAGADILYNNWETDVPEPVNFQKLKESVETYFKVTFNVSTIYWIGLPENWEDLTTTKPSTPFQNRDLYHIDLHLALGPKVDGKQIIFFGEHNYSFYTSTEPHENSVLRSKLGELDVYVQKVRDSFAAHPEFQLVATPIIISNYIYDRTNYWLKGMNNSIVEIDDSYRAMHVPYYNGGDYSFENIDYEYFRDSITNVSNPYFIGEQFKFIGPSYDHIARNRGGLNCITKVFYRAN